MASWLDGGSSSKIAGLALNTAVAGEPLEVLVSVSNPLALELSVSRMRLTYEGEHSSASEAAASREAEPAEAVSGRFAEVGAWRPQPLCTQQEDSGDLELQCACKA